MLLGGLEFYVDAAVFAFLDYLFAVPDSVGGVGSDFFVYKDFYGYGLAVRKPYAHFCVKVVGGFEVWGNAESLFC